MARRPERVPPEGSPKEPLRSQRPCGLTCRFPLSIQQIKATLYYKIRDELKPELAELHSCSALLPLAFHKRTLVAQFRSKNLVPLRSGVISQQVNGRVLPEVLGMIARELTPFSLIERYRSTLWSCRL